MVAALIIWMTVSFFAAVIFGAKYIIKRLRINATATVLSLANRYEARDSKGNIEITYKYLVRVNYGNKVANANFYEPAKKNGQSGLKINDSFPAIYDEKANYLEGLHEESRKFKYSAGSFLIGLAIAIGYVIVRILVMTI